MELATNPWPVRFVTAISAMQKRCTDQRLLAPSLLPSDTKHALYVDADALFVGVGAVEALASRLRDGTSVRNADGASEDDEIRSTEPRAEVALRTRSM